MMFACGFVEKRQTAVSLVWDRNIPRFLNQKTIILHAVVLVCINVACMHLVCICDT